MKHDVIIIGGGLGGLECGYILARSGRSVLVLEQGEQPGGCLQSYRRRGVTFDTGFHYVGGLDEGQSLHAAFKYMGLLNLPWQRLDKNCFDRVVIGERNFAFAQGYDNFAARMAENFPTERDAINRYTAMLKLSAETQYAALNPNVTERHQGLTAELTAELMGTSAWQYLTDNFRNPLLINVLSGTSLKMELRRESLPLFTFLHGNSSYIESSWRLMGDGSMIAGKLADGIRAQGGEIVCNARVQELVETGGQITTAVCANGERYEAGLFISDVHPEQTCRMIKQSRRMRLAYRNRIAGMDNTFGMFTVSLRIRPRSVHYLNHNIYIYEYNNPDVWNFYTKSGPVGGVLMSFRVPEDGSDYTEQIDLLTPMTWERCREWSRTAHGRRDSAYKEMKHRVAGECLDLAERVVPGLRELSRIYTSTPLTWNDYTLTPEGSAYGLRKDYHDPLLTLLSPRTPIPNLLLTGQNLMLHGVHGVTMTALHTCAEAMGREAIWRIIERR